MGDAASARSQVFPTFPGHIKGLKFVQTPPEAARLRWVDTTRGMAILWIALFHCFIAYGGSYPWLLTLSNFGAFFDQCAPDSLFRQVLCATGGIAAWFFQRGSQAVGVFILFSGFGLSYSLSKREEGEPAWGRWYRHRLFRLFPIYWIAHLVFLVSPFQYRPDPIDYRFVLSFLGDRVYPVGAMFYYLVPAWWFLGLLIELYIVFPVLFRLMRRLGTAKFLVLCIAVTIASRYLIFSVLQASGNYIQGALFTCRLWEFAAGMALGRLMAQDRSKTLGWLFSWKALASGAVFYLLGTLSYQPNFLYTLTDGLMATGLSAIMVQAAAAADRVPALGPALAGAGVYSYSIYLFHQPYVMYCGEKLRPYPMAAFLLGAAALIALIAFFSMRFEALFNRLSRRFFPD